MLKSLRIKFIAILMAIVVLVLGVSFTAVCYLDFQQSEGEVYEALTHEISQGDYRKSFPGNGFRDDGRNPRANIGGDDEYGNIPIAVYLVNSRTGRVALLTDTTEVADEDVLTASLSYVGNAADSMGFIASQGLYYAASNQSGEYQIVAFADTTSTRGWISLAWKLLAVGLVAAAAFFLLSLFLSKWIIRPAEQAWEAQKRFIADASHELKTPLTVIMANNSILASNANSSVAEQSKWIESTQNEAEEMQQLINEMLTLARADTGAIKKTDSRVDLSEIAEMEVLQFESVAFEKAMLIDASITPNVHVLGNKEDLHKLLGTLLDNALKYSAIGNPVTVNLWTVGKQAVITVNNIGEVIPEEDLPHIFERFYRSDKSRTKGGSGTSYGLGMAIAQGIVTGMKGTITVQSAYEDGTTFTVCLPLG